MTPACPTCGAPALPEYAFCPACGTALAAPRVARPAATLPAPPPDPGETADPGKTADPEETAVVGVDDVRTGITPAEGTLVSSAPAGKVIGPPASVPPTPGTDVTLMPGAPAMPDVTMMPAPQEAATMAGGLAAHAAGAGETAQTIMQAPPHGTTAANRRPKSRKPSSRSGSGSPATYRPGTAPAPTVTEAGSSAEHLEPGEAFGTRYRITKMLGIGGMGAVYQAWDAELGVTVAIKTIRPGVGTDAATALDAERRFKRELLLARQVTHPNVVRIYDLGEIEGTKYITMSFVDGCDLASILSKEGQLPLARALPIMRQVMAGMGAAHAAGIVHRDLKPANIMVDASGQALVMDFGIARSVNGPVEPTPAAGTPSLPDGPSGTQTFSSTAMPTHALTVAGSVMGTLDYMAPEQAKGQQVDQRADVYALGLILRDVVLGRAARPKSGNAFQDLKQRMAEALPAPRTVNPEFPEALDQIVTKSLAIDPAERYASAVDMAEALDLLDDEGKPKPLPKLRRPWMLAVAGVAMIVSATAAWYLGWSLNAPVEEHPPVTVLIADFQNQTGDPAFDHTLEPVMRLALEGAGFITAMDRSAISRTLGVRPPETLDENAAIELAVKQGVGVVVAGTLTKDGDEFNVSVRAAEAVSGTVVAEETESVSAKDGVLSAVANLAGDVREALGDNDSDSAQRFAKETLSVTSLDAVRSYARGMDALSRSQFNDALQAFSETVGHDAKFGLAYAGMAIASSNMGRQQDAEKYVKEAIGLVDGMTERERFRTRGMFYFITNDYQPCVKEYGDLIARFSSDAAARNNRALCLSKLRDMKTAVDEMREVVKILPNRTLYRVNLATYAAYNGDVATAEEESRKVMDQNPWGLQSLSLAQTLQGQIPQATQTYQEMGKSEQIGPSYTASGLGDLALYEGRFEEAARIFTEGAAADFEAKEPDRGAAKLAALAYTELLRGRKPAAIAAAEKALEATQARTVRFLAARVLVEAGAPQRAKRIAVALGNDLQPEAQALASIIDGMIAMTDGDNRNAVRFLTEANTLLDTWIGHFELGRAYLQANAFLQADSEFDRCVTRRGEALSLFLDDDPTFGYFPAVHYYQGRVREGLKSTRAAESYKAYLAIRGQSKDDPLVPEIRKQAGTN